MEVLEIVLFVILFLLVICLILWEVKKWKDEKDAEDTTEDINTEVKGIIEDLQQRYLQ